MQAAETAAAAEFDSTIWVNFSYYRDNVGQFDPVVIRAVDKGVGLANIKNKLRETGGAPGSPTDLTAGEGIDSRAANAAG